MEVGFFSLFSLVLKQSETEFDKKNSPPNFWTKIALFFGKHCNRPVKIQTLTWYVLYTNGLVVHAATFFLREHEKKLAFFLVSKTYIYSYMLEKCIISLCPLTARGGGQALADASAKTASFFLRAQLIRFHFGSRKFGEMQISSAHLGRHSPPMIGDLSPKKFF